MLEQGGGGHIINVTTTLAEQGQSAVPSALTALPRWLVAVAESLAVEYAAGYPGECDIARRHRTPMHSGVDAHDA